MDSLVKLYLERAENEVVLAEAVVSLSSEDDLKSKLKIEKNMTFYSAVISHSYYAIFYCARAYLLSKGIKVKSPREHQKTYNEFGKLVKEGTVEKEFLELYKEVLIKADTLLDILKTERKKRGEFTYEKLPQANRQPALDSLGNAQKFFKHFYSLLSSK